MVYVSVGCEHQQFPFFLGRRRLKVVQKLSRCGRSDRST